MSAVVQRDLFDGARDRVLVEDRPVRVGRFQPRPYQALCVRNVFAAWEESRTTLVVMGTGLGKTVCACLIASQALQQPGDLLFLAHREELLTQAADALCEVVDIADVEIEAADQRTRLGDRAPRVVVASKDSMCQPGRLALFASDRFTTVVIDEAHHAIRANASYSRIVDHFARAKVVGFTATPDRGDGARLDASFECVAFSYDIGPAIDDGWLVPLIVQAVAVKDYDISAVRGTKELNRADLSRVLEEETVIQGVAAACVLYSGENMAAGTGRPTLVFTASVPCAVALADILNRRHYRDNSGAAAAVWSSYKGGRTMAPEERRAIVRDFRAGRLRYLVNYGVFGEGVDFPEVRLVVNCRPSKQRNVITQIVGRVLRPLSGLTAALAAATDAASRRAIIRASAKPGGMVVDLTGATGKHKLISPLDVLGGSYDLAVVARAKQGLGADGRVLADVALLQAQRQLEEHERQRRRHVIVEARLVAHEVDPFDLFGMKNKRAPGWYDGTVPTAKQLAALTKAGFTERDLAGITKRLAGRLLGKIARRRASGQCSLKQAQVLARYGEPADCTYGDARAKIDAIAANGWNPLPR